MKSQRIPYERLLRQRIAGEGLTSPADVVRWLGAVQAQDYPAAKWALGLRTVACTDPEIESAFAAGQIVRTHVMRPTWHIIAPENLRWMQALTASHVRMVLGSQFRSFGLDASLLRRCNRVIEKALQGRKHLTRTELAAALRKAGIQAEGVRLANIIINAELDALICSGARRGKQFTYALVDERAPQQKTLNRDEGLALLTERFFTSHGPATAKDFAWWSGLTLAEIKRGLEMAKAKLISEEIEGQGYWMSPSAPAVRLPRTAVYLLPNYDEYLSGYTDRSAIMDAKYLPALDARHNPLFNHPVISNGRVAGTWKRSVGAEAPAIEAKLFAAPTKAEAQNLERAAKRMARFFGLKAVSLDIR